MLCFSVLAASRLCAAVLLSFITVSIGSQISVRQHPENVRVAPGGSVALVCEFHHQTNKANMVSWYRGKPSGSSGEEKLVQSSNIHFYSSTSKGYSILVLKELRWHESVMYFCEVLVIFPPPALARGNGTLLEMDVVAVVVSEHTNHTEEQVAAERLILWQDVAVITAVSGCCGMALMASVILLIMTCMSSRKEKGCPSYESASQEYEDMNMVRRRMHGLTPHTLNIGSSTCTSVARERTAM